MPDPNTGNRIGNIYMTEELQTGDSRWLDVVMRSILEECRVLGLFPKEPFEFGTTPGEPKRVSIAIVLNTGGKSIEQFANFPVRGQLRSPEIIKPPDISLNSEDGRIDHGWSPFLDNSD